MRRTLRRSCAACAKAKHKCDLQTPQCTRCTERKYNCIYANQPLAPVVVRRPDPPEMSLAISPGSIDPFDTYPVVGLPRARVQMLIRHCKTSMWYLFCYHVIHLLIYHVCSSHKDRVPVLSMGFESVHKPVYSFLVAAGTSRSTAFSC